MKSNATPEEMIQEGMKQFGVSRETAIMLTVKGFEATLRVKGRLTDLAVEMKIAELLVTESKKRTPWYVELMQAHYGKKLPMWAKIIKEATEQGHDPATVLSMREHVSMPIAYDWAKLVKAYETGLPIAEVTEIALGIDDKRSADELHNLIFTRLN